MTEEIDTSHFVRLIEHDTDRVATAIERFGTEALVAHCGDWCVGDVVKHLGVIHRWAAQVVRTQQAAERSASAPDREVDLPAWLREGAADLCSALKRVPPDTECWTFGRPPANAGFWARRQALETAVHRWDVEHALGLDSAIRTDLAVEGIAEVVDFLFPRQIELGRADPLPARIVLAATDVPREWVLGGVGAAEARVSGAASDLLLSLWKRPHGSVICEGDAGALAAAEATAITP